MHAASQLDTDGARAWSTLQHGFVKRAFHEEKPWSPAPDHGSGSRSISAMGEETLQAILCCASCPLPGTGSQRNNCNHSSF